MRISRRAIIGGLAALSATAAEAVVRRKRRRRPAPPRAPKPLPAPTVGPFEEIADRLLANLRETACYNGTPDALNG